MLKNYFRIAWRNLTKNKLYSFINIGGLSIGISVCMLIMIYVAHEKSFDRFHKNADRIFSVSANVKMGEQEIHFAKLSYRSGPMVKQADPSVESFLRIITDNPSTLIENLSSAGEKFTEKKIILADSNFFNFFTFHLRRGNSLEVLNRPFTMVISERAAYKYFGYANPVGKLLKYDNAFTFEITGVSENPPSNSSIDFDFVGSLSSIVSMKEYESRVSSPYVQLGTFKTFLLLKNAGYIKNAANALQKLSGSKERPADASEFLTKDIFILSPLKDEHYGSADPANFKYLKIFPLVAGLILLLALINYMSLATARATIRAKEIGVRKVLGANRSKLAKQFYSESALYALIAFFAGFILFRLTLPYFYNILQLTIDKSFLYSPLLIGIFTGLLVLTILIAGSYPSLVLSSFNPVMVLYGKLSKQKGGTAVRKIFTVLQFSISVILIICSAIIDRQLYFFRHTDTGITKQNIIMIPFAKTIHNHYHAFKKNIESLPGISQTATAEYPMYKGYDMFFLLPKDQKTDIGLPALTVDSSFISLLNLQWKIPPFEKALGSQTNQVVINEEAIHTLNLPSNPVGQKIAIGPGWVVGGVLKNFNFTSLHDKINALCLFVKKDTDSVWGSDMGGGCLFAKVNPGFNLPTLLSTVKKVYDSYDKETPFEYQFMDDAFDSLYKAEDRLSKIFTVFTGLTICIACLGLFGLAAFSATQRTKEIGIRKVLGASVTNIVVMLSGNFIRHVMLAIVIAIPISWFAMNKWLQEFAYRIHIDVWVFVLTGFMALLIALVTVSFLAMKAAIASPVKSLRTE
jgi:putative ABC transport system permease protein